MLSLLTGASLLSTAFAAVQFAGVNIAGFDFGCGTDGTCVTSSVDPPLVSSGGSDGAGQMAHFATADNLNIFRLPVAWQYLVNNVLGGTLDSANLVTYDELVQACLATKAHCIIDIHNYARWNGGIIGQGGPTNDEFASLWSQLATKYASSSNVVFGIMNEPHDISDIDMWGDSVQAAVTAIRTAGATSQYILLPGNAYTSAETFVSGGSAAALSTITNLDSTTTNLIFDVHKYLDSDGSGTSSSCTSDQVTDSFSPLATYLRTNNRMAILSETGGGSDDSSCLTDVCSALSFLDVNSDVYLGYVGWAAGSFASSYVLSLTPSGSNSTGWTDQSLLTQCFAKMASEIATASATSAKTTATANTSTTVKLAVSTITSAVSKTPVSSSALASATSKSSSIVTYAPTTFATRVVSSSSVSSATTPVETDDPDTCS